VKQLKLYMDDDKVVRCRGRIHNAPLNDTTKFPVLLPARDKLTNMIIMDAHTSHLQSGLGRNVSYISTSNILDTDHKTTRQDNITQVCYLS